MVQKRGGRLLAISLLLLVSVVSCLPPRGVDRVAAPYAQDTIRYHLTTLAQRVRLGLRSGPARLPVEQEVGLVEEYFTLTGQIRRLGREVRDVQAYNSQTIMALSEQLDWARQRRDLLKEQVEAIIARQVGEALSQAGLVVVLGPQGLNWFFPPSQFFLLKPPLILVTSPRTRIELAGSYLLGSELPQVTIEDIERQAEAEGVSALVERTGGFSLYPAWVSEDDSLRHTLDTVAHEWVHAYLFLFFPLGRSYLRDYQMRTINETVADIIGHEIGEEVYRRCYARLEPPTSSAALKAMSEREAEFARQMRRIRAAVDNMLGQGRVEEAEAYMEVERGKLEARGYYLRRLNHAYLALHGTYADKSAFEAPIGTALKNLRAKSSSLGEFVRRVGSISSYSDLQNLAR